MYVSNVLEKTIVYTEILRRSFVFVRSFTEWPNDRMTADRWVTAIAIVDWLRER